MKSFFKVLLNIFTFGIPLFLEILSNSRKFSKIMNDELYVTVNHDKNTVRIRAKGVSLLLEVDDLEII